MIFRKANLNVLSPWIGLSLGNSTQGIDSFPKYIIFQLLPVCDKAVSIINIVLAVPLLDSHNSPYFTIEN